MAHKLKTPTQRAKLAPSTNPYFERIERGLSLGLYVGAEMRWLGRVPDDDTRWKTARLGAVEPAEGGLSYSQAVQAAIAWRDDLKAAQQDGDTGANAPPAAVTVGQAVQEWLDGLQSSKGSISAQRTVANWRGSARRITQALGAETPLGDVTVAACHALRDAPGRGKAAGTARSPTSRRLCQPGPTR